MLVNSVLSFSNQKYLQTFPGASCENHWSRKEVPTRPGAPYKPQVSKNETLLINSWTHFQLKLERHKNRLIEEQEDVTLALEKSLPLSELVSTWDTSSQMSRTFPAVDAQVMLDLTDLLIKRKCTTLPETHMGKYHCLCSTDNEAEFARQDGCQTTFTTPQLGPNSSCKPQHVRKMCRSGCSDLCVYSQHSGELFT